MEFNTNYGAFFLKFREERRQEQLTDARTHLQERYNEEAGLVKYVTLPSVADNSNSDPAFYLVSGT